MDIVLQQIVNAISLGGIYALLALGLAVVFSIVSLINFAHGELMTVAGYGMFFAAAVSLPFPVAVAIAVVFAAIAAVLTERFAFRPMRKADATGLLLLDEPSLGLAPLIVDKVFDLILGLRQRGLTILLVEQNAERALEIADHGYVLQTGQIVLAGSGAELASSDLVKQAYLAE